MASPETGFIDAPQRSVPEQLQLEPENARLSRTSALAFQQLANKLHKLASITEHNDPLSPVKKATFPFNDLIPDDAVIDEATYEDFQHIEAYAGTEGQYSSGNHGDKWQCMHAYVVVVGVWPSQIPGLCCVRVQGVW